MKLLKSLNHLRNPRPIQKSVIYFATSKHTMNHRIIFSLLLLLAAATTYAGEPRPQQAPTPSWVTNYPVPYTDHALDGEAESGYVDLDYEKQVSVQQHSVYFKSVVRVISEAGVQNSSQVSVSYDPSYQRLVFHTIRIIRDGRPLERMDLSKFKTVHQEKELDRFLYNGMVTSVLFLEDVQQGDIIEYSYSLQGFSSLFTDRYADTYDLSFAVPICQLYYKLVMPQGRNITVKNNRSSVAPVINGSNYEWRLSEVHAVHEEDNLPSWYDPYASVMVSEYRSWNDVATWASALFPFGTPPASIRQKAEEIRSKYATDEERVAAALHFVQDGLRYMGVEISRSSYQPHAPAQVMAQRFGDCKDKSYLLCTLLRAMGLQSNPVLINTSMKKNIGAHLPSPLLFDHCTASVLVNGKWYWLDPTIADQRGALGDIAYPDYQTGLVVSNTTTDLTAPPTHETGNVDIKEVFLLQDTDKPARFTVTTRYSGSFADNIRYDFKNNSLHELKKSDRDYYADYFDRIDIDSLTYSDNEQTGVFTTVEYYTINRFWRRENGTLRADISPFVIEGVIKKPKQKDRSMPFALIFPARYHETIEVHMPDDDWNFHTSVHHFAAPGFTYDYTYGSSDGNTAVLNYDYENKKDFVAPEEAAAYFDQLDQANGSSSYQFTLNKNASVAATSPADNTAHDSYSLLYMLLGGSALVTYLVRRNRKENA